MTANHSNNEKWKHLIVSVLESHHFPLSTNVWTRAKDDQQARLIGQIQKVFQIPVTCELVDPLSFLVEVPGDVAGPGEMNAKINTGLRALQPSHMWSLW